MALTFNGNSPTNISYNGNSVSKVVYNGVKVWPNNTVYVEYEGYRFYLTLYKKQQQSWDEIFRVGRDSSSVVSVYESNIILTAGDYKILSSWHKNDSYSGGSITTEYYKNNVLVDSYTPTPSAGQAGGYHEYEFTISGTMSLSAYINNPEKVIGQDLNRTGAYKIYIDEA